MSRLSKFKTNWEGVGSATGAVLASEPTPFTHAFKQALAYAAEHMSASDDHLPPAAVAPEHPTKQDVGMNDCEKRGMNPGYWDSSQPCLGGKIVSGDKIVEQLSYEFKWPDPMEF